MTLAGPLSEVDFTDLVMLAQRYNTGLADPAAVAAATASSASFATAWAAATGKVTAPSADKGSAKKTKPTPVFSVAAAVARPATAKQKAPQRR